MFDQYRVKLAAWTPDFVVNLMPAAFADWYTAPVVEPKPMSTSAWLLISSIVLTAMFISPNGGLALLIVMPINVIILISARIAAKHETKVEVHESMSFANHAKKSTAPFDTKRPFSAD